MQPQDTNTNPGPSSVRPVGAAGAAGAARPVRPVVRRPVAVGGASAAPVTPAPEPVKNSGPSFDNGPSVVGKKERKTGWILAIILLLLIAAGGVGFGVWMWMDGNTQKEALNNQINSLQQQNGDLLDQISNSTGMSGDIAVTVNPVVESQNPERLYGLTFSSSNVLGGTTALGESSKILDLSVENGKIVSCMVSDVEYHEGGGISKTNGEECIIGGLDGDIYKIVEFGAGHDNLGNNIGFIMTDGTVYYLPLYESVQNNDYNVRGRVNISGEVRDIITTGVSNGETGWIGTVFVLKDGTIVEYDESMLE